MGDGGKLAGLFRVCPCSKPRTGERHRGASSGRTLAGGRCCQRRVVAASRAVRPAEHVEGQDCVAFTGSAETGRWFSSHPNIVRTGARVSVEADSVNAAVIGPDVRAGTETYDMLVNQIVREVTQKAGQKCTAIRRVLVTPDLLDDLAERLVERLELEPVGDPAEKSTRVGPLVDAAQCEHAADGIAALLSEADLVWKGTAPASGCFVAPHLLKHG